MKFLKMNLLVLIFLSLYACAMVDSASRELMPQEESNAPKVYYVGVAGLKMFSQSKASGSPIAELPFHAKVLRYKMERGFAYVKVTGTGQVGWVRNRDLIWRKQASSKVTPKKDPPPREKEAVASENKSDVNPDPNPDPNSETQRRDASMFDAF
ncbi:MAG: hypothetical protein GY846_01115 [Deltaproteobacteria bacterium]|nr:hypothetical protein [Deltaproteobacteria bacterium]